MSMLWMNEIIQMIPFVREVKYGYFMIVTIVILAIDDTATAPPLPRSYNTNLPSVSWVSSP